MDRDIEVSSDEGENQDDNTIIIDKINVELDKNKKVQSKLIQHKLAEKCFNEKEFISVPAPKIHTPEVSSKSKHYL